MCSLTCYEIITNVNIGNYGRPLTFIVINVSDMARLIEATAQEAFLGLWQVRTLESGPSIENPNGKS